MRSRLLGAQARFLKRQLSLPVSTMFAVVSETVEQRSRHLRISEHARPFAESEVGGHDDRGSLVEPADEMEQQLSAGLCEGEITQFVENDEVEAGEVIGDAALATGDFRPRAG
jgi:hypothetical protein